MFPEWHHAVPESAYFKVPETLKTFRMYSTSRFVYVLHWLAARLVSKMLYQMGTDIVITANDRRRWTEMSKMLYQIKKNIVITANDRRRWKEMSKCFSR